MTEANILENTGQKIQVDLTEDDLQEDNLQEENESPDDNENIEGEENIYAGEGVQQMLDAPEEEASYKIEAATDDEILQEEERLNIASEPINEPNDGEVEI